MSITEAFESLTDPRRRQGLRLSQAQVLTMVLISYICGHYSYRKIETFAQSHSELFEKTLGLKHGVPSYVTFREVLVKTDQAELIAAFNLWAKDFVSIEAGDWLSGDGKSLSSTVSEVHNEGQGFQSVVSFFVQKTGMVVLLETYKNQKKSEIDILIGMLNSLKDKNLNFVLDALHIQRKTVDAIVESGNHYTIQVKENQPSLYNDIEATAASSTALSVFEEENKGHGRLEKRRLSVYEASDNPKLEVWRGLKSYIVVERWRTEKGVQTQEKSLYISDLQLSAKQYYEGTRGHWGIENRLHYVKDVVHNEDNNGVKSGNAPVVLSICSTIAINIHRKNGHDSISYGQIKFAAKVEEVLRIIRT